MGWRVDSEKLSMGQGTPMPTRRIKGDDIDVANLPLHILRERLRELLTLRSTNAKETSIKAGLSDSYVSDIFTGKSKNPRMTALQAIAEVLQVDLRYLLGQSDTITAEDRRRGIAPIPVKGIVEVGAYRPMLQKIRNSQGRDINADLSSSYPHAGHFALQVRDDAMSDAGIRDGMTALCVELATAGAGIENGKIYAIRRSLDGGKTFETSLKRAHVYRDRIEYRPESNDPDYKQVTVSAGSRVDDTEAEIETIGLVYAAQIKFD